jgi:TatA/E family protein of Tat protein translocase
MFNIGPLELMVILVIALLVVGPRRLPEVGRSIGRGLREFRRAQEEVQRSLQLSLDDDEPPARKTPTPRRSRASTQPETSDASAMPAERSTVDEGASMAAADAGDDASDGAVAASPPDEGTADEVPEPSADEVARTLGRSIAELRRAREELRRSFRMDLDDRE